MTDSPGFALFVLKRIRTIGTRDKKQHLCSSLLSWISLLPPAFSSSYLLSNVRSDLELRLEPYRPPLAHVDTMKPPFVDVSKPKGGGAQAECAWVGRCGHQEPQ